jgi:hypothetical protein
VPAFHMCKEYICRMDSFHCNLLHGLLQHGTQQLNDELQPHSEQVLTANKSPHHSYQREAMVYHPLNGVSPTHLSAHDSQK